MNIIPSLIANQKDHLDFFFNNINYKEVQNLLGIMTKVKNLGAKIIITGVGKNENVSKHLVSLLNSINFPSVFLSVLNSLHGDIGIINKSDLIMMLSNSGNTEELIKIASFLKMRADQIIGIFSNPNAGLNTFCDHVVVLPKLKELDRFNLIPTSSILSFTIFCNLLVAGLIEYNNITIEEYSKNHPNGNIGNKIFLKCRDIMLKKDKIVFVNLNTKLKECLLEMCSRRLRCAIVISEENHDLLGIMTDGDIRRFILKNNLDDSIVLDCLNSKPITVNENDDLDDISQMVKNDYRIISGIPVVNEKQEITGLISQEEIIKYVF